MMMKTAGMGLVMTTALLSACGGSDSSTDSGPQTVDITVPFQAVAGDTAIACNTTLTGLGTSGTDATLADFRFFIHDLKLVTDEGVEIPVTLDAEVAGQNADVALLDFRDVSPCDDEDADANAAYKDSVVGTVTIDPALTLSSVRFTLGVPFDLNHANQADAVEPLRNPGLATGMAWSWQAGYKFIGLDVFPVGGITRPGNAEWSSTKWNSHLGSTGCPISTSDLSNGTEPEPCTAANRVEVTLPLGNLDLDQFAIQLDYAELVSGSNLGQDAGGPAGCMSGATDPECEAVFDKLGLAWGENAADTQSIFSIVDVSER